MLHAYIKPSNFCPVGCQHCYVPETERNSPSLMSFAVFEKSLQDLSRMAKRQKKTRLHVTWHGGEPMAVPIQWYATARRSLYNHGLQISESMQTSLYFLTPEWVDEIRRNFNNQIGVSLSSHHHSSAKDAKKHAALLVKKLHFAREKKLDISATYVPAKMSLTEIESLVTFCQDHNIDRLSVERLIGPEQLTNLEHSQFLKALALRLDGTKIEFRQLQDAQTLLENKARSGVWGTTCQYCSIVIDPSGLVSSCPNIAGEASKVFRESSRKELRKDQIRKTLQEPCKSCEYVSSCQSSCPLLQHEQEECRGYASFLRYAKDTLK